MPGTVYLNTSASLTGAITHAVATSGWTATAITLAALDKTGLGSGPYYVAVADSNSTLSNWYGPFDINTGIPVDATFQSASGGSADMVLKMAMDATDQSVSGGSAELTISLRAVFINDSASDIGASEHPYTNWTDSAITLAPLDITGYLTGNFYLKVRDAAGQSSAWYGPFVVNPDGVLNLDGTVVAVSGGSAELTIITSGGTGLVGWNGSTAVWDGVSINWGDSIPSSALPISATIAAVSGGSADMVLRASLGATIAAVSGGSATCVLVPSPPILASPIPNLKNTIGRIARRDFKRYFLYADSVAVQAGTLPTGVTMTDGVTGGVATTLELRTGLVIRATNTHGFVDSAAFTWEIRDPVPTTQTKMNVGSLGPSI